jgi:DNA-binding beta-propeller fold protein YncE
MNKTTQTHRFTKGLPLLVMATLLAVLALDVALNLVATAQQGDRMYWTDVGTGTGDGKIQRADLNGDNVDPLVITGLTAPFGIALDVAGGKMYWTNASVTDSKESKIQRANLDGSAVEDLVTDVLMVPSGIALDVAGGKMYWTDMYVGWIQRANLDGSNIEDLVTTALTAPAGIALDVAGGKMYWTDERAAKIQRANLNGDNVEDLVTDVLSYPVGIALDVAAGKMYWTDAGMQGQPDGRIQRADLNGDNVEDLVCAACPPEHTALTMPIGIALDVAAGKMYWTDTGNTDAADGKIQRANLDGSTIEDLVTTGLTMPFGIALELVQEPPEPVGGIAVPVNMLGLLAPWMGLAALISLAAFTVAVVRRRKP